MKPMYITPMNEGPVCKQCGKYWEDAHLDLPDGLKRCRDCREEFALLLKFRKPKKRQFHGPE